MTFAACSALPSVGLSGERKSFLVQAGKRFEDEDGPCGRLVQLGAVICMLYAVYCIVLTS